MREKLRKLRARYEAAMHAVQSGVAMFMNIDSKPTDPKHLRVGINSCLVDLSAIAVVLIKKGLMTEEEYLEALAEAAEREKRSYEEQLSKHYGKNVTLG